MTQRTTNRGRWPGPSSATSVYSGTGSPRAWSASCSALLWSTSGASRAEASSGANSAFTKALGGLDPAVQVEAGDEGLVGVGPQRRLGPSTRFLFALPQQEEVGEA